MQKLESNAGKFLCANHQVRLQEARQQIKEEAFQDGDFIQKAHQYLSSPNVLENICRLLTGPILHLTIHNS